MIVIFSLLYHIVYAKFRPLSLFPSAVTIDPTGNQYTDAFTHAHLRLAPASRPEFIMKSPTHFLNLYIVRVNEYPCRRVTENMGVSIAGGYTLFGHKILNH